jgi:hypothetical protein
VIWGEEQRERKKQGSDKGDLFRLDQQQQVIAV